MKKKQPVFTAENWPKVSEFVFDGMIDYRRKPQTLLDFADNFLEDVKAITPQDVNCEEFKPIRRFLEVARATVKLTEREKVFLAVGFVAGTVRMEDETFHLLENVTRAIFDRRLGAAMRKAGDAFNFENKECP